MKGVVQFIGNFVFIVILFLLLFSYAMFQGGFVSWFLFFSFLPIFLYHIGLLLYPIKKWKITRSMSHHVIRAGDGVSVKIRIRRSIPFPLYYCICEEVFPNTLKKIDSRKDKYHYMDDPNNLLVNRRIKKIIFPSFRREFEISYALEQVPRGEHHLQAVRIRTGDVFGFVKKEHVFELCDQLVAYPNERPIHIAEQITSYEHGSTSSYALNLKNSNVATGIREYMPGDRFSWIDWKQTARKNTVMTKEFEQEKSTDILLILDGCYHEGINHLAFEATVEMTISLMEEIRRQSTQIGLVTIGEEAVHFHLHYDPNQKDLVRQHLTRIQPIGRKAFTKKLKEEMTKMDSGNIVMIITSRMDESFHETLKKMKQRTKRVIVLFVQSSNMIATNELHIIQQLQFEGIGMIVLTEDQLVKNPIEVSIT